MGGDGIEREYRRRRQLSVVWWHLGIDMLVYGAIAVQTATVDPPFPAGRWFNIAILVLISVRGVSALLYRWRGRTVVSARGITAHESVRTVTRTWHDIYDIRAELNDRGVANAEWTTYVYDGDGRRTRLPYFDDWQRPDFHAELADLRAVSAQHRGVEWELRPEVEDRIRVRARHRKIWVAGVLTAAVAGFFAFMFLA
ncbi:PH domain-containing protein [Streptomyces sp. NPDC101776]|uniref:PH domain-containing protein n=1 Tax=Streptomyces sp. NPDC101776 TaxID=3366146 RepID=UPI003805C7A7